MDEQSVLTKLGTETYLVCFICISIVNYNNMKEYIVLLPYKLQTRLLFTMFFFEHDMLHKPTDFIFSLYNKHTLTI